MHVQTKAMLLIVQINCYFKYIIDDTRPYHRAVAPTQAGQAMAGPVFTEPSLSWLNLQFLDESFH